jgi:predicted ATP-grasp superfamily ATP-dependent carboligase
LPRDGRWLVKPLASGGGLGVEPLVPGTPRAGRVYFQERVPGPPFSAVFIADRRGTRLVGATRQLIGRAGAPFAYTGSVGPWPLDDVVGDRLRALGEAIAEAFRLIGLFGVDLVLRDDHPWPVEVNPRYTASVEVLERATGGALIRDHWMACDPHAPHGTGNALKCGGAPPLPRAEPARAPIAGKAIVFAVRAGRVAWAGRDHPGTMPAVADIPHDGAPFAPGEPLLTVFADGTTTDQCLAALQRRTRSWVRRFSAP